MGFPDRAGAIPFIGQSLRRRSDTRGQACADNSARDEAETEAGEWGQRARSELLEQISGFLIGHELDVTPANLAAAHAAFAGSDLTLAARITERQIQGDNITQQWLDSVTGSEEAAEDQRKSIETMMDALEASISGFAKTTLNAATATGEYRSEFSEQVCSATAIDEASESASFLRISQAMLETLHRIESDMKRSQSETEHLQDSLNKARREANCDHLTGLPNRRAFERELYAAHHDAVAHETELSLAICDVDHFKRVNDTFGHETGDRLLRAIAAILQCYASEDCFVARHGGEEFVMLMRGQNPQEALSQLDDARSKLERRNFVDKRKRLPMGKITFSAGIADALATTNPRDALAAADEALYQAKEAGRNQIVLA